MNDIDYIINYLHDNIKNFSIQNSKHYKISGKACMSIYINRTQVILYNIDTKAFYFLNAEGIKSLKKYDWPYNGNFHEYPCYICTSEEEEFQMSTVLGVNETVIPYSLYPQVSKILDKITEMIDQVCHL